jgi:hypothetical protein
MSVRLPPDDKLLLQVTRNREWARRVEPATSGTGIDLDQRPERVRTGMEAPGVEREQEARLGRFDAADA